MYKKDDQDLIRQPLMSTGTTEAGFNKNVERSERGTKPKIGETVVGDDENGNKA